MEEIAQLNYTFDATSFISSIASIVLAIVSLILSILFYFYFDGNKTNKETMNLLSNITAKSETLNTLFDKMFTTSFRMIESQSIAMQNKLFDSKGTVATNSILNYEFEVMVYLNSHRTCEIGDISKHFNIEHDKVRQIISKISERGVIVVTGEAITMKENDSFGVSTSEAYP